METGKIVMLVIGLIMFIAIGIIGALRYKHVNGKLSWWEVSLYGIGGIIGLVLLIGSSTVYLHEETISEKHG